VTLLIEVIGVLVLGTLLGVFVGQDGKRATALGLTMVALAVMGLALWGGVWSTGRAFVEQAESYPSIHEANIAPGSLFPADENLLNAAEGALPRHTSVYLVCGPNSVGCSP
jgi:hypothetical protein